MKKFSAFIVAVIVIFISCSPPPITQQQPLRQWVTQSNIYEVNVRQFTPSGTFNEFATHLPRLREMGVEILWFMPITPIGLKDRKNTEADLGSYYAVKNYKDVNPEFGTMQDWKNLVQLAHDLGFKVITDWVPNHTAADHPWIQSHPNFYARDEKGEIVVPFDWTDVRKLNYGNAVLRDSMIASMKFWITETGIDGFRCDVAEEVPGDFWEQAIPELRKLKDVFMLAEADHPHMHAVGFDATYTWSVMGSMTDLIAGKKTLTQFDSLLTHNKKIFPENVLRMFFTTNHDENSWNGTEFEKYGAASKPLAVFTQTFYQSVPLIYNGQEEPLTKRLKFFTKDTIPWNNFELAPFYSTLLHLRRNNAALASDASYTRLPTTKDNAIFAYAREKDRNKVVVILNLSNQPQQFQISNVTISGNAKNVFTNQQQVLRQNQQMNMAPWEYLVLEY